MAKKKIVDETTTENVSNVSSVPSVPSLILSSYSQSVISGVRACVALNESALFIGETGTGKTTLVNELAKESGKKLHRVSVNGSMGVDEILGKWLAKEGSTYWIDGLLTRAVREGDWVIFDEMNAMLPEMGFAIHSLLDEARAITLAEKDGEVVKAHSDFRFFGSMNPSEDYAGTKEMNIALISRFAGVFYIDVFPIEEEVKVLRRHDVTEKNAISLVNLADQLRVMRKKGDMSTFISTRDIIQAGKLAGKGILLSDAITFSVFNKLTAEERDDLAGKSVFRNIVAVLPETEKEKSLRAEIETVKKAHHEYEKLYAETRVKHAETTKELNELKANPLSVISGLDPKTAQLLKTLGVLKS